MGKQILQHYLADDGIGGKQLHYTLPKATQVHIDLYSIMGQHITRLYHGKQLAGAHQLIFYPHQHGVQQGQFFYQIQTTEARVSGGIQFF